MVSEGVDIPRLAVGVYATSTQTPLFFAQAVGRFVRARRPGETASVFLPSVPSLLALAGQMEVERDHALDGAGQGAVPRRRAAGRGQPASRTRTPTTRPAFTALQASAHLDRVIYDGGEYGTGAAPGSPEEEDFLGLPGLLLPDQVRALLAARASPRSSRPRRRRRRSCPAAPRRGVGVRGAAALRKELSGLVGAMHHRTGKPHGVIHAELRTACGGPPDRAGDGRAAAGADRPGPAVGAPRGGRLSAARRRD